VLRLKDDEPPGKRTTLASSSLGPLQPLDINAWRSHGVGVAGQKSRMPEGEEERVEDEETKPAAGRNEFFRFVMARWRLVWRAGG